MEQALSTFFAEQPQEKSWVFGALSAPSHLGQDWPQHLHNSKSKLHCCPSLARLNCFSTKKKAPNHLEIHFGFVCITLEGLLCIWMKGVH